MAASPDEPPPLPLPAQYFDLLAEYGAAYARALEDPTRERAIEAEDLRLTLLEAYEWLYDDWLRR